VRIDRPPVNALDLALFDELATVIESGADGAGSIVLTGAGRTFSAGVDLRSVLDGGDDYVRQLIPAISRLATATFGAPVPVVAAVNGAAIAGGCVLAAACDRGLIADTAIMGATEVAVGVPFPLAAMEVVRIACGSHAEEVVLGADVFSPEDALRMGLVDRIVPADELLAAAVGEAHRLAAIPAETFAITRRQLRGETLERIRRLGPEVDEAVTAAWAQPEVAAAIRGQVGRMSTRRS
jgi:enoyl-CoA hydratase/carnithine racemase